MKNLKEDESAEWSSERSDARGRAGPWEGRAPATGSLRRPLGGAIRKWRREKEMELMPQRAVHGARGLEPKGENRNRNI